MKKIEKKKLIELGFNEKEIKMMFKFVKCDFDEIWEGDEWIKNKVEKENEDLEYVGEFYNKYIGSKNEDNFDLCDYIFEVLNEGNYYYIFRNKKNKELRFYCEELFGDKLLRKSMNKKEFLKMFEIEINREYMK